MPYLQMYELITIKPDLEKMCNASIEIMHCITKVIINYVVTIFVIQFLVFSNSKHTL